MASGHLIIDALYGENYSNILKVMPASAAPPGLKLKNVMKFSTKLKFYDVFYALGNTVQLDCTQSLNLNSHSGHGDMRSGAKE